MNRTLLLGAALASIGMSCLAASPAILGPPPPRLPRTEREDDEARHLERKRRQSYRTGGKAAELRNRSRGAGRL